MFSVNHIIWIIISIVIIITAIVCLVKYRPDLRNVLTIACTGAVISEIIKVFSMVQMVPSSDGTMMIPYMELQHLPFHLCSIQIIFIFYTRFAEDGRIKEALLAFMYPTCMIGSLLALAMPSIFAGNIDVSQAFTHPLAYQYFLYHSMLFILGTYIAVSGQAGIKARHYFSTVLMLLMMGFMSIYINSLMASPTYINGELVSVDYTPNFFFTFEFPVGIVFTEIWHWYLYIAVIAVLAAIVLGLFYLPFRKTKKDRL